MAVPKKRRSSPMFKTRRNTQKIGSILNSIKICLYCKNKHRKLGHICNAKIK